MDYNKNSVDYLAARAQAIQSLMEIGGLNKSDAESVLERALNDDGIKNASPEERVVIESIVKKYHVKQDGKTP